MSVRLPSPTAFGVDDNAGPCAPRRASKAEGNVAVADSEGEEEDGIEGRRRREGEV
jgi:hypothetical protein